MKLEAILNLLLLIAGVAAVGVWIISLANYDIYPKLPPIVKTFVTAERLTKWVEEALAAAKAKWESNIAIAAYIEQPAQSAQEAPQSEPDGKAE